MAMTPTKAEIRCGDAILEELAGLSCKMRESVVTLESALNACGTLPQDVQDALTATMESSQALFDILCDTENAL